MSYDGTPVQKQLTMLCLSLDSIYCSIDLYICPFTNITLSSYMVNRSSQGYQGYTMGKRQSQQMVLGKGDVHMQKNEIAHLFYDRHKN